ncbi:hypothetical protein NKH34_29475 [Mesorhizobium sp. M1148]|uniref:hypothetical protein n=1 Tax=unclassified Mesorhizobium TaxID=325217 RepID=UPI0004082928|nr:MULTISPECIES: hypothetical protein [unclassified Mesorhizobium]WJI44708.1 hypothetical protein NL532_29720 [Mesorhizobium sp. C120A]
MIIIGSIDLCPSLATSAVLGKSLHSRTAANLAHLVRIMNTYYSNLIEGHDTRPRDIEGRWSEFRCSCTSAQYTRFWEPQPT